MPTFEEEMDMTVSIFETELNASSKGSQTRFSISSGPAPT